MRRWVVVIFALAACAASQTTRAQVLLPMTAHEAFLRLDPSDTAVSARIVALADHGLVPGQFIHLESVGDYDNGPGTDIFTGIMGVFSSSATLLAPTNLNRVPGAIDAGIDHVTIPTCPGNLPTDIPQDFTVNPTGADVLIPAGATHLFLATRDCLYWDNSDPDADFAVRLTPVMPSDSPAALPTLTLGAPHPNPARDRMTISCSLPAATDVRVTVHAVDGRVVRELLNTALPAGSQELVWDSCDTHGARVAAGVYFARVATARGVLERRVVIVR